MCLSLSEVLDRRSGLPKPVGDISVSYNSTGSYYDVTVEPHNCASGFNIMRVVNAARTAGSSGKYIYIYVYIYVYIYRQSIERKYMQVQFL